MMKLSWTWPSGRKSESAVRDVSGGGIEPAGNSPCASRRRESLPEGGGPGVTWIGGALKSSRGEGPAGGRSENSGSDGAVGSNTLAPAGGSFSIIWLNSEYGSFAAVCAGEAIGRADAVPDANDGAGRLSIKRSRSESRTKSCTNVPWRKRTSVFDGCTLTSTSSASHSRNSSANGYAE